MSNKKNKGQFYTTNCSYILEGFQELLPNNITHIIEPFAGKGDLISWIRSVYDDTYDINIEAYDIEPKSDNIITRDTLQYPPDYTNKFVITNPPYLARNKNIKKELYDLYDTNDLYKCFIKSIVNCPCIGGIIIIPAGFFFSPRKIDIECRNAFMEIYKIIRIKYFEETVFDDTTTTIVAILFIKSDVKIIEQNVEWYMRPSGDIKTFAMKAQHNWIIGGEIYNLPISNILKIRRYITGQTTKDKEQITYMTLNALDSGSQIGRISLEYKDGYIYPAKDCSRTFATICISGRTLSEEEQKKVCKRFNEYIESVRKNTYSLFLPQYRESKEYARKRIPFELAYQIINYMITNLDTT